MLEREYQQPPYKKEYIEELLKQLGEKCGRYVVLTGVCFDDLQLGAATYDKVTGSIHYCMTTVSYTHLQSTSLKHLCDVLSGTKTRLLVVGGAGSLYVNPEHTACVADGADFPDAFKPLAAAMAKALGELRQRKDVQWTYISPAGDFQAEGERTGKYIPVSYTHLDVYKRQDEDNDPPCQPVSVYKNPWRWFDYCQAPDFKSRK